MTPIIYPPQSYEFSLVLFTVFSQLAAGVSCFIAYRTVKNGPAPDCRVLLDRLLYRRDWLLVLVTVGLGMFASLFHLGHPYRAPLAISNLSTSWLSREILIFSVFSVLALLNVLAGKSSKQLALFTAAVGVLGVLAQGFTYAPASMPALGNGAPLILFAVTALAAGSAFAGLVEPKADYTRPLLVGLALFVAAFLAFPALWSAGETVVKETGQAWFASAYYWPALVCAVLAGLLLKSKPLLPFASLLVLVSALAGRLVFFGSTLHTAAYIGQLY